MAKKARSCNPELWGGIESTINRVGDSYNDQLCYSGHYDREDDLDAIASLGIKKIRYPLLWEKHQPAEDTKIDWSWAESRLSKLRELDITPIAGLVHHGSGPAFTSLDDPKFPDKLAAYAAQVAERFPWLDHYTPVNEPLTTARFSGLYGLWYPHGTSDQAFLRMLLHQLKGVVLSMQAIRRVNPSAKLIQTEDLGKTYSTPRLRYQARFENLRRWLTYDLLCGTVDERHPLWKYFLKKGIEPAELNFFLEQPCIPDVFGFNHYVTSERFLDDRLSLYPKLKPGGNGRHRYVDVEAVRVQFDEPMGIEVLLEEAWQRYQKPMAVTEVHLHCHREEQLRWFQYVWNSCNNLISKGADIKAITAWALLGSFGWNKLLTSEGGVYEPGVFDVRSGRPRPTALTHFIRTLQEPAGFEHPIPLQEGWWQRPDRFLFVSQEPKEFEPTVLQVTKPLLILGKNGPLARAYRRICEQRCIPVRWIDATEEDLCSRSTMLQMLDRHQPWAVVLATAPSELEHKDAYEPDLRQTLITAPSILAGACAEHHIRLVSFSNHQVFDGLQETPYTEQDPLGAPGRFGANLAEGEQAILAAHPDTLLIRTGPLLHSFEEGDFIWEAGKALAEGMQVAPCSEQIISPTSLTELVHHSLDLLIDGERGIWHLCNEGGYTRADLLRMMAERMGWDEALIQPMPVYLTGNWAMQSKHGALLSSLDVALDSYAAELRMIQALEQVHSERQTA